MKAFHKACGSSNLIVIPYRKGKKEYLQDVCLHCVRPIEEYEINRTRRPIEAHVSEVKLRSPYADDNAKLFIQSYKG